MVMFFYPIVIPQTNSNILNLQPVFHFGYVNYQVFTKSYNLFTSTYILFVVLLIYNVDLMFNFIIIIRYNQTGNM